MSGNFPVHFAYYLDILYCKVSRSSSAINELVAKTFRICKNFPVTNADGVFATLITITITIVTIVITITIVIIIVMVIAIIIILKRGTRATVLAGKTFARVNGQGRNYDEDDASSGINLEDDVIVCYHDGQTWR